MTGSNEERCRRSDWRTIRTERLTLRPVRRFDASPFLHMARDRTVSRMTASFVYPQTPRTVSDRFAKLLATPADAGTGFIILHRGEPVGSMGLHRDPDGRGTFSAGYLIARRWRGKGFASEAMRALLTLAFHGFGAAQVHASVFVDNPASARVLRTNGFTPFARGFDRSRGRPRPAPVVRYRKRSPFHRGSIQ